MMEWTDRHYRYFMRLLAPRAELYTEMVNTGAIVHGDRPRFLDFDPSEHPVVLQLGGADPRAQAPAAAAEERAVEAREDARDDALPVHLGRDQPDLAVIAQFVRTHQQAVGLLCTPAYTPAKLMQL